MGEWLFLQTAWARVHDTLSTPYLLLLVLAGLFWLTGNLRRRLNNAWWVNPTMITTFGMIAFLSVADVPYERFEYASGFITFWLQVAVVCLAVPLYVEWPKIKSQWVAILVSQLVACLVAIITGVLLMQMFGAGDLATRSVVAKSVTTPIAIEVTTSVGGVVGINAFTVLIAGVVGQVVGLPFFVRMGVRSHIAKGLAMGSASHALGISTLAPINIRYVAYGTVGLIVNGVMTAFVAPLIVPWLV